MDTGQIIDCGCDYIRFTVNRLSPHAELLGEIAYDELQKSRTVENPVTDRRWLQFNGMGTKRVFWGQTDTHVLIQASSSEAKSVAQAIKAENVSGKCTRLDLQVTVDYGELEPEIGSRLERAAKAPKAEGGPEKRSSFTKFSRPSFDTGVTVGSRTSDRYLRFYHAQTGGHELAPFGAYRAEIEYKNARSKQAWAMMQNAASNEAFSASMVTGELLRLGIKEPWFGSMIPAKLAPMSANNSHEKSLRWLRNQVMPKIQLLSEAGFGAEIDAMYQLARGARPKLQTSSESQERAALARKYFPWRKNNDALLCED